MSVSRRAFLASAAVLAATPVFAAPISALGRDATQFGVKPNSTDDQTRNLQRAIDEAAKARVPLALPAGTYRSGMLTLRDGTQIAGVRGATKLVYAGGGASLLNAEHANVMLDGLTLDGGGIALADRRGLVHCEDGSARIRDCDMNAVNGVGIWFDGVGGEVANNSFTDIARTALVSFDARGLIVSQNALREIGDNGIEILRSAVGHDGTIIVDNRIEGVRARSGGTGQYGNAINAFRAGNVVVRGNRITDCALSGVRGNSASGIQILGNSIMEAGEVALYSEFAFEGAVIAQNVVDGAKIGVSVANFNEGGRLAVVQGNIIRNLHVRGPYNPEVDDGGVGIYVEADSAVSGNVVENAPFVGIFAGWGKYLRDVAITGNVLREAFIGVGVSALPGAATTLVSNNVISGAKRGAIVGMDHGKPITADLTRSGAEKLAHLTIGNNQIR